MELLSKYKTATTGLLAACAAANVGAPVAPIASRPHTERTNRFMVSSRDTCEPANLQTCSTTRLTSSLRRPPPPSTAHRSPPPARGSERRGHPLRRRCVRAYDGTAPTLPPPTPAPASPRRRRSSGPIRGSDHILPTCMSYRARARALHRRTLPAPPATRPVYQTSRPLPTRWRPHTRALARPHRLRRNGIPTPPLGASPDPPRPRSRSAAVFPRRSPRNRSSRQAPRM